MSQPYGDPAGSAEPGRFPVLDTKVGWTRLYADPRMVAYGRHAMALDQVEWVAYGATRTATKRFLYPTTHHGEWDFAVGRYPYHDGQRVAVNFYQGGRRGEQPAEWAFLVSLARQYLEPRLLAELVGRVRRGETVTVGGSVKVNRNGIGCVRPRLSLPWASISAARHQAGMVLVHQAGVERPVLTVPHSHPNAWLIPALFAAVTT